MKDLDSLDLFFYQCGVIDAFNEVVKSGVKRIALSHPVSTREEALSLVPFSEKICAQYGNHFYFDESPLLTDLFPISLNKGKFNIIYYRKEEDIQLYLSLKEKKKQLIESGNYHGQARKEIAVTFGRSNRTLSCRKQRKGNCLIFSLFKQISQFLPVFLCDFALVFFPKIRYDKVRDKMYPFLTLTI